MECKLLNEIPGTKRLQLARNRLRLKAVDLVGNYIVFSSMQFDYPRKEELFEAFVNHSQLNFEAQLEKFSTSQWEICDDSRCLKFWCAKKDFTIEPNYSAKDFNMAEALSLEFKRKQNITSACRLAEMGFDSWKEEIETESFFLSGRAKMNSPISQLLLRNPGNQLESSLFEQDSLIQLMVKEVESESQDFCDWGMMIQNKILFTCAGTSLKDQFYENYLDYLSSQNDDWSKCQYFLAQNRDASDFHYWEEATSFEVIGAYPGALNVFGMHLGFSSEYYEQALQAFAKEDIDLALELLQNQINFNGITAQALNLTGACYRLKNRPAKALSYLLLAYYLDGSTPFLAGNTMLCLKMMNYGQLDETASYFLSLNNLDPWSKNQIENLIKQ